MAGRWRAALLPIAVVLAVAEVALIVLGVRMSFSKHLVWIPALGGLVAAVAAFRGAATGAEGPLRAFWLRVSVAMAAVLAASVSQAVDIATLAYTDIPPVSERTLLLYVLGTLLAIAAMLRLPTGERTWRRLATALLDVAVVTVTAGIAASHYLGWAVTEFGGRASAWWLNIAMVGIGAAGVVVVVKIMTAGRSPVPRAALWWLAPIGIAGPLSAILMTVLRPWPHLNGSSAVLPFVGLCGVLAAHAQHRARADSTRVTPPSTYRRGAAVALVATGLISVLLTADYLRAGRLGTAQVAGTALLLLLVVARQAVALGENATLLRTVEHQTMHDELTGLYSRRSFTAAVAAITGGHTVLLIDLRDFRAINDGLGPAAGDALLVAYAQRLTTTAGEPAVVARLGGDEFGLLLAGDRSATAAQVERLLAANAVPLSAAGHEVLVEVSVGVAHGDARDAADLYRRAELALRESTAGRPLVSYDASLERRLNQRATLAADLRRALHAGDFHLLYQPIVELPHGRLIGVEALIRWTAADGRIVSPADFIPVAEDTGIIVELGAWIIDAACAQSAAWRDKHGPDVLQSVAVNVSARQLLDPALPDVVAAALARHGIPAHQLTIEITETAVFGGGWALATVQALSELGVSIALDDFGTGHSSLGLLRTCPVDAIKVDKSFVDGLGGTPQQEAIATALTGIAETMGLRTVAEGVETSDQARRLFELGYRRAQGFHFARPLPAAAIDAMLRHEHPAAA